MRSRLMFALIGLLTLPLLWSLCSAAVSHGDEVPFLQRPTESKCVLKTGQMRARHPELLKELRDEVVREGRRSEITLARCAECHPDRSVFCDRCHEAVNLEPDCFSCHLWHPKAGAEPAPLDGVTR